jgi:uncharacterized membrane protein
MAEAVQAVQANLNDMKVTEANKSMAAVAWIPLVGLILMFVEKKDQLVRYNGAQSTVVGILELIVSVVLGAISTALLYNFYTWSIAGFVGILSTVVSIVVLVIVVFGIYKTMQGGRFDLPVVSGLALKLMNLIK